MRNKVSPFLALTTIKTYICMNSEFKSLFKEYYDILGFEYNKSRVTKQVQARAAIMTEMSKYIGANATAKAMKSDHATVCYHKKRHKENLKYWVGYAKMHDIAKTICSVYFSQQEIEDKIKTIEVQIKKLQDKKTFLQEKLNSTL
jgi:hypothetical protein